MANKKRSTPVSISENTETKPQVTPLKSYYVPTLRTSVQAESVNDAIVKAKKKVRESK